VDGDDSSVDFGQKFSGEKGSVRWYIVMLQQITSAFAAKARG
jgi:hypothetical protein